MQTVDLLEWLPAWTKVLLDLRVTTLVIALATAANVFVAWVLWRATKKSSDAARDSAVAAIRSAQAAEHTMDAMYRPYFAVCGLEAVDLADKEKAHVKLTLKNYGPVPLMFGNYLIELVATGDPTKPAYHEQFGAPATSVVLPADEATFRCGLSQPWLFEIIHTGDVDLVVTVVMDYADLQANRRYQFRSEHRYKPDQHLFEVLKSSMT